MEQTYKTHKVRDFAIGFFGWFLFCTLGFSVSNLLGGGGVEVINGVVTNTPPTLGLYWDLLFPVVTAIVIGILFFKSNHWLAYGILAALTSNTLVFIMIFRLSGASVGELLSDWNTLIGFLSTPFFMVGGFY